MPGRGGPGTPAGSRLPHLGQKFWPPEWAAPSADAPPAAASSGSQAPRRCRLSPAPCLPRAPAARMPPRVLAVVGGQVLPAFLLCSTLLVIKMYAVAVVTGQVRLRKKVCARRPRGSPLWPPRWAGPGCGAGPVPLPRAALGTSTFQFCFKSFTRCAAR